MEKLKNRFLALLIAFTSITSFFPASFIGQVANAATIGTDAKTIQVSADGTTLTSRTDGNEIIYSTANVTNKFAITLNASDIVTSDTLYDNAMLNNTATSGITAKKVEIVSINGTRWDTSDGYGILHDQMGIDVTTYSNPSSSSSNRTGVVISNLPFGVNKIEYKITITTVDVKYTPAYTDPTDHTKDTPESAVIQSPVDTVYDNDDITIEHGTQYVVGKIDKMIFNAYVGDSTVFDPNTGQVLDTKLSQNNTVPFLYSTVTAPDKSMPLRYNFDVPDSTSTLKYSMMFGSQMVLTGAKVYKNGKPATEGTEYQIDGHTLNGSLERLGKSDLIVVKLGNTQDNIQKVYSIEIKYNNLNSDSDYSLYDAGITKADYNDDTSVLAYIGKKFDVTTDTSGFKIFSGNIYIDPRARLISIDPILTKNKQQDNVAYIVTNNYVDSTGSTRVAKSQLKNGKQYIDFMAGSQNTIQVDVYPGQNGNVTDSSKLLARYQLAVNKLSGSSFSMDLAFDGDVDDGTYLTQPGVKENIISKFTTDRRTYDLYTKDPDVVNVAFTGARSNKNEYIRVWLADGVNSTNLVEADASVKNTMDSNNLRQTSLDIALNKSQKMVVQAYYDDIDTAKSTTSGGVVYTSEPLGDKYVFYLPSNYTETPTPSQDSNEASLNSLKITGYTLEDSNGNKGFSSDTYDYTVTVNKEDTTEKITVVPQDSTVKSITGAIAGSDESYDFVSGEASDITLSSTGKTTLKIVVTAQDGVTTKTYTVTIKNNTKGSNVNLKNVILSTGDYTFDPKADVTKVRVDQNVNSIKITPVSEDSKATVTVNGEVYTSTPITVSLKGTQKTDIQIEVTSEDGTENKTYTLEVNRVDASDWDNNDNGDKYDNDQFYDEYNDCWVDLSKYDEWGTVNGKPVYFDKKGRQVKDAWISTGGKYYYLNNLGYKASGWKVDDKTGQAYYLDPATGEMKKGWINLNNTWYYLGQNGIMHKGWLYLNGKWYYFTPNGQMVVNQSMYVDDKVYNFGQDGAVQS
ncbi:MULTISPECIES: cadherin-like beta sandwich domain-containing protein [unclassified Clostridium]|uniref:N-acetylmuramoyl-L-alanine amidase family protein n=1 Tax=unclassified Clostridium TaxID=2614128 RepID=UPI000297C2FC|nr:MULTISPECIES: cadherin-like beta sandwich domain-containing protein [unclassified Clostridium]EKQ50498.1 MAG: putative cell wall binding protein [Clostridium sp. Maddingley MBC34-26]